MPSLQPPDFRCELSATTSRPIVACAKGTERWLEGSSAPVAFPGEAITALEIGPDIATGGPGCGFLVGETFARRVGGDRVLDAEQAAEVIEMRLRGAAFLQLGRVPFVDEFLRGHALPVMLRHELEHHGCRRVNVRVFWRQGYSAGVSAEAERHAAATRELNDRLRRAEEARRAATEAFLRERREAAELERRLSDEAREDPDADRRALGADSVRRIDSVR